jgi:hypothetical protein
MVTDAPPQARSRSRLAHWWLGIDVHPMVAELMAIVVDCNLHTLFHAPRRMRTESDDLEGVDHLCDLHGYVQCLGASFDGQCCVYPSCNQARHFSN